MNRKQSWQKKAGLQISWHICIDIDVVDDKKEKMMKLYIDVVDKK